MLPVIKYNTQQTIKQYKFKTVNITHVKIIYDTFQFLL